MRTTPVSKPCLLSLEKYVKAIRESCDACHLTNNEPFLQRLGARLVKCLDVAHVICVGNGTLALQLAYRAPALKGEAITTPFSFVATSSSSLVYEGIKPVFSDINESTYNLSPEFIEEKLTGTTSAIVSVH